MRKNLIDARKEKKLTQIELANLLSISDKYYQNIEYGARQGSIEIWDKLEDLFKIPQRQLRESQPDGNPAVKKNVQEKNIMKEGGKQE